MLKLLKITPTLRVTAPSAGDALAEALDLVGWLPGFPDLPPGQAETDAEIASQPCYLCGCKGQGRALPMHTETGRYRLLVAYSCCGTIGEP